MFSLTFLLRHLLTAPGPTRSGGNDKFTAEAHDERILKIGQHLETVQATVCSLHVELCAVGIV